MANFSWAQKGKADREAAEASFTCPLCGMKSYNKNDVLHRYCGNCHTFADYYALNPKVIKPEPVE